MSTFGERGRYHHGDLRQALVSAARDLVRLHGPSAVSLREAARLAGVSHNAPYRHFASREALLAAVAAAGFEGLRDRLLAAARSGSPTQALGALGEAYVRFAVENRSDFALMFGSVVRKADHPDLVEAARAAFDVLRQTVGAEQEHSPATERQAIQAWAFAHGLAHLVADEQLTLPDALAALRPQDAGGGGR